MCLISGGGGAIARRARARAEVAQRLRALAQARRRASRRSCASWRAGASPTMRARSSCDVPAQVVDQPVDVGRERGVARDRDRRPLAGDDCASAASAGLAASMATRRSGASRPTPSQPFEQAGRRDAKRERADARAAATASRSSSICIVRAACGRSRSSAAGSAAITWLTRSTSRSITERSASALIASSMRGIVGTRPRRRPATRPRHASWRAGCRTIDASFAGLDP